MFQKLKVITLAVTIALGTTGCLTRVESGEIGVRVDMSKQVQSGELMPGSWNQTVFGDVLTFPVRDITISVENKTPMTADNSALQDFDITAVYSINPSSVAELYTTKAKSFHQYYDGDWYLMYNYIHTLLNNASYKTVRNYKSLELADNRQKIEQEILATVNEQLLKEKLDTAINISVIQVRNILPNAQILQAATDYVKAQNEIKTKEAEVRVAELEAKRMQTLASNSTQSIAYLNAQANLKIAEAIANGKVNTIVVPSNLTMLGSVK